MATTTSGSNITTTGRIQASDLNDIANHFRQWFSVSFTAPSSGARITASDFNNLRQAIIDGAGTAYSISQIPSEVSSGQKITSTTWGSATANFSTTTVNYTSSASYTIPVGCNSLTINQLVGAGAGGNFANAQSTGNNHIITHSATSGGGGSGGLQTNYTISVSSGEVVTINVGVGGSYGNYLTGQATDGGDSSVLINGNSILTCTGGSAGTIGNNSVGTGGTGGSPNGNNGGAPNGGASPYNGYGAGGNGITITSVAGAPAVARGEGTSGTSGYCSITYNP